MLEEGGDVLHKVHWQDGEAARHGGAERKPLGRRARLADQPASDEAVVARRHRKQLRVEQLRLVGKLRALQVVDHRARRAELLLHHRRHLRVARLQHLVLLLHHRHLLLDALPVFAQPFEHRAGGEVADVHRSHREEEVLGDGAERRRHDERLALPLRRPLLLRRVPRPRRRVGRVEPVRHVGGARAEPRLLEVEWHAVPRENVRRVDLCSGGVARRGEAVAQRQQHGAQVDDGAVGGDSRLGRRRLARVGRSQPPHDAVPLVKRKHLLCAVSVGGAEGGEEAQERLLSVTVLEQLLGGGEESGLDHLQREAQRREGVLARLRLRQLGKALAQHARVCGEEAGGGEEGAEQRGALERGAVLHARRQELAARGEGCAERLLAHESE
mmetsp:Transcript_7997/g.25654  ORF Transcript_7997/g.25654 Transcript_7997/m.25654 type:complete len:385 (-) Transcript_7997:677-1831(-)